jgi:hypothetical protein
VNDEHYKAMKGSCCGIILSYYASICLEGLKDTAKYLNQDSRSPHRDLNLNLPNMKQESLPLDHDVRSTKHGPPS